MKMMMNGWMLLLNAHMLSFFSSSLDLQFAYLENTLVKNRWKETADDGGGDDFGYDGGDEDGDEMMSKAECISQCSRIKPGLYYEW